MSEVGCAGDITASVERDPGALRELWSPLAEEAGNPFLTWEWASTWWRHLGDGKRPQVVVFRDEDDRPIGIAPLYWAMRRPFRVLRFIGHFPADQLGPVCAPGRVPAITAALRRHLESRSDWDLFLQERLPGGLGASLPGSTRLRAEPMPELELGSTDWDEFLAGKSKNFRGQARTKERRLLRDRGLRYRLADDPDRLDEDLETLFALHQKRWNAVGMEGAFDARLRAFHREFAHLALAAGQLRFWIADLDGKPAAAWYGFRFGGVDWFYQSGRDPELESTSIGFVLMTHTVRDAVESGIGTYNLLLGGEEYKARFSNREGEVVTSALPRGPRGRAALWAARRVGRV